MGVLWAVVELRSTGTCVIGGFGTVVVLNVF